MSYLFGLILILEIFISPTIIFARTTPEDIVSAERGAYLQKISHYSETHQTKLKILSDNIATTNKQITDDLEYNVELQGEILNEYQYRIGKYDPTSNVARPNGNALDNAHYWLTYAHEAVAFQATHIYIFNLSSETNIKSDTNNLIANFQSDISTLQNKVEKSRQIIARLVKGE